jgi:hypothetical protein
MFASRQVRSRRRQSSVFRSMDEVGGFYLRGADGFNEALLVFLDEKGFRFSD